MTKEQLILEGWNWHDIRQCFFLNVPGGYLELYLDFLPKSSLDLLLSNIFENNLALNWEQLAETDWDTNVIQFSAIDWKRERVKVFGKWHLAPRLTAWEGDKGVAYTYSGVTHVAGGWQNNVYNLKEAICAATGLHFNSVLYNWYRDGMDTMGWHADNERELGRHPQIASFSIGAARTLRFRKTENHRQTFDVQLSNNSLLIMGGALQEHWQHALPQRKKAQSPRINLTFRNIISQ